MFLTRTLLLLLAITLAGCGSAEKRQEYQANLDSLWAGIGLSVKQPIPVAGGKSHVLFMGGSQVTDTKRFEPACRLEVNSNTPQARDIPVGNYPVQSVNYRTSTRGGPSSRENNIARFTIVLQDSRSEVRTLICWKESQGQVWRLLAPEQINVILGTALNFE